MTSSRPLLIAVAATLSCMSAAAATPGRDANELIAQLGADSYETRETALRELIGLGDDALPALDAAARSSEPEVRWRAEAAGRMIRWRVSPELYRRIGDAFDGFERKKWFVRERIVTEVAAVGGKAALPTLVRIIDRDKSERVRRAAASALAQAGPDGLLALEQAGAFALVEDSPADHAALLVLVGNALLNDGAYEQAIAQYRKALEAEPQNQIAWYNVACAMSLLNRVDEAMDALREAVRFGYDDFEWMDNDADLENVRNDARYPEFRKELEGK